MSQENSETYAKQRTNYIRVHLYPENQKLLFIYFFPPFNHLATIYVITKLCRSIKLTVSNFSRQINMYMYTYSYIQLVELYINKVDLEVY